MTAETPRQRLFAAAWRGNSDQVRELVTSKAVNVNAVDENNVTALRFTAQYGHLELTKFLLQNGADPNIKAHDKIDPLLAAVEQGHKEIVILLLANGAKVNSRTKETNALRLSKEKGHTEMTDVLLEAGATESMGFWKDNGCSLA